MGEITKNDKVESAIRMIAERYKMGQEILKKCGDYSPVGVMKEEARKYKISRDTCQKLRVMATPDAGYTPDELAKLYERFRTAGYALTISHFVKLVSVPKGERRNQLTESAIKNRWSSHRLQAEILACQGRRRVGGRRPNVVKSDQIEVELIRILWSWDRWLKLNHDTLETLRPEHYKEVKSLHHKIEKLQLLLGDKETLKTAAPVDVR